MSNLPELWKDVVGYEGVYAVSNLGRIKSLRSGKLLAPRKSNSSLGAKYRLVLLFSQGASKSFLVHRLVAVAFINNPENKPQVNHIDGDGANNNIVNLEWVTCSENCVHRYRVIGARHPRRGVTGGDNPLAKAVLVGGEYFPSITMASIALGVAPQNVSFAAINGGRCKGKEVVFANPA